MSFISPLERLADKFNIVQFNTRELISKLSVWATTTSDNIEIVLKVADEPFFENYTIPSLHYIKTYGQISNWTKNRPVGVKYWGSTIFDSAVKDNDGKYTITLDNTNYPPTHYIEYNKFDIEQGLTINLDAAQYEGDIINFIIKINPSTGKLGTHFVYINDLTNLSNIIMLGKNRLSNLIEQSPVLNANNTYPIFFKVSLQYINTPSNGYKWVILDLYEIPDNEYDISTTSLTLSNFADPFIS